MLTKLFNFFPILIIVNMIAAIVIAAPDDMVVDRYVEVSVEETEVEDEVVVKKNVIKKSPVVNDEVRPTREIKPVELTVSEKVVLCPIYTVDGDMLDEDLQDFLYERLKDLGIEWWMPFAILTAYQESSFDIYQVTNGVDSGLFQFRSTYWQEKLDRYGLKGDIFNPYVQIELYCLETAYRLGKGLSIERTISNHKQSDWGPYDQAYVDQVLGHDLKQIR